MWFNVVKWGMKSKIMVPFKKKHAQSNFNDIKENTISNYPSENSSSNSYPSYKPTESHQISAIILSYRIIQLQIIDIMLFPAYNYV
jgi:hypothetical protein